MGNGSDLLVSDRGIKGVVLCTAALTLLQLLSENKIRAMAGAQLGELCRFAQREKLSGLEFAYGIPGTVGGAVFMNAGAYGGEIKQVLCSCRYLSPVGETVELSCEEMELSYRHSVFSSHPEWMVLSADFRLNAGDGKEIQDKMEDLMGRRKAKQPLDFPSGGSTFKRPEGYFAAALIEQCGLKGFQIGQAAVSEKHAGFASIWGTLAARI